MLVIGERKMQFRVNVGPMSSAFAPKNYGPVDDLSAIRPAGGDAAARIAIANFAR